jgi:hypothetical protein
MDRAAPPAVKTVMFCLSTSSIKTRVHFFPTAGSTTSHQPISCVLSLFGKGIEKRAVMLDGGRLNQPDGVRLEDAFPNLRNEASGIFGLEVQLSSQQGRINLLQSQAAIELVSPQASILYYSSPFVADVPEAAAAEPSADIMQRLADARRRSFVGVGMQDSFVTTSLVMVNSTKETVRPSTVKPRLNKLPPTSIFHVDTVSKATVFLSELTTKAGLPPVSIRSIASLIEGINSSKLAGKNSASPTIKLSLRLTGGDASETTLKSES